MEIRFNRSVSSGGLDGSVEIENGKARVEFTVYLSLDGDTEKEMGSPVRETAGRKSADRETAVQENADREDADREDADREDADRQNTVLENGLEDWRVEIRMYDQDEQEVAGMRVPAEVGESLCAHTLIIYPHLWKSVEEPYLYRVQGTLLYREEVRDVLEMVLPICTLENVPDKGWYLNGRPFELKAIRYRMPEGKDVVDVDVLEKELDMIRDLGANCVLPDGFEGDRVFRELCMKMGLIVWNREWVADGVPLFCGGDGALLGSDRERKSDLFYYYKACWAKDKVLHICWPVRRDELGETVVVKVYSNQKKVALYVDGRLQEFKESAPVFLFEDVPVKWGETVISAQAGECFCSVTV